MKFEDLLLILMVVIPDVLIGIVVNKVLLAFNSSILIEYLFLMIVTLDIIVLAILWDKIMAMIDSIFNH
jgi:hypothetical protein